MPRAFTSHIRAALGNPDLQVALDANAERRQRVHQAAFASLPDPQAMRRRAHAVRAETIANLDRYLARFSAQARANGVVVHRAEDAAQATAIVLDIAHEHGARVVAKAKTMVSEEVGLNHGLEADGIQVVETDLGEYIVQLRNEKPSHIITPAVHLRRGQVGETFHEKLGIPLTDEIAVLTQVARRELRQVFLRADMGISGVNFGVAETGTLCIVTNEGNGRMVTTLPRVHVALMGIERLVPTLDDLALMLALLPRAATGQAITVYTTLLHGPRRPGEPDGPQQRHLILVDNGRTAMRASPLAEALLCIRCGACLNACPVFREIGGHAYVDVEGESSVYPGPIGSIISPALFGQPQFGHLARASTLCGACREACPVDIDLPGLLLRTRAGGVNPQDTDPAKGVSRGITVGLRLYTWLATRPQRFAIAQRLGGLLSRLVSPQRTWMRLPAVSGWGRARRFPRPAVRPFRDIFLETKTGIESAAPGDIGQEKTPATDAAREAPSGPEREEQQEPDSKNLFVGFSAALTELGGVVTRCAAADLAGELVQAMQEYGADSVLSWDRDTLPVGLLDALQTAGIRVVHPEGDPVQGGWDTVRVGLTGALAAIAETGSLVIPGGPGRSLNCSLLTEVHLAVLREADLYENLPQALTLREVREASSVVLVSGPSRTADIEMTLTIGVHGPGAVHVFCIWN